MKYLNARLQHLLRRCGVNPLYKRGLFRSFLWSLKKRIQPMKAFLENQNCAIAYVTLFYREGGAKRRMFTDSAEAAS